MTQLAATDRLIACRGAARVARYFWPIAAALLLLRLLLAASCNLVPDEAFYWTWTRHLATGYFDHPPMIAWVIWLSTRVMGNTELGVRLPAAVLSIASLAVLYWLARRVLQRPPEPGHLAPVVPEARNGPSVGPGRHGPAPIALFQPGARAVGFVLLMWITGPLLPVLGTIITPDAPATFFSVCALACAVLIADYDDRNDRAGRGNRRFYSPGTPGEGQGETLFRNSETGLPSPQPSPGVPGEGVRGSYAIALLWLLFGAFCGLAFLSKYTTVLLPAGVGLAMLFSPGGRRQLMRPWPYLSGILAIAVFSPCILWNYHHGWASFLFQLHHGAGGGTTDGIHGFGPKVLSVAAYIGGQAAVWTPILFGITVVVMIVNWRKYKRLRHVDRVLLWSGTLPLIFFGVASTSSHGEINWPAFAYFPLSLLIGRYLSENWRGNRVQWVSKGCEVALALTIGIHLLASSMVQKSIAKTGFHLTHQITDLWGWREFGEKLAKEAGGFPVVCNRHQDAGEAAFYMPGQPDVWCDGVGSRPTAFDFFDHGRPDLAHAPRIVFVGGHAKMFMEKWGFTRVVEISEVVMKGMGKKGQDRVHVVTVVARNPHDEIRNPNDEIRMKSE